MKLKLKIHPLFGKYSTFVAGLFKTFDTSGEVLFKGRNTLKSFNVNGLRLLVKSFKIPNPINRIVYSYFRISKAKRSFLHAEKLTELGVETPKPVAYLETHVSGLIKSSFYISECLDGHFELRSVIQGGIDGHLDIIKHFAGFVATELHARAVLHKDLSPGNVLIQKHGGGWKFYLVDLNRMVFKKSLTISQRAQNLKKLAMTRDEYMVFMENYLKLSGIPSEPFSTLLQKAVAKERRRMARKGHSKIEGW